MNEPRFLEPGVQPDGSVRVRSWEPVEAESSTGDAAESAPL